MSFEPKILGILCNWCSYAGADLAGTARISYAPNLRVVRVMCSGRVDPSFIFYQSGNYKTMRRFPMMQRVLEQLGVERDRVRLEWVSASEGERWASVVNDITEKVRALGPFRRSETGAA